MRAHKAEGWTVLRGRVYAVAHYVPFHPGGSRTIIQGAGKDMTKLFDKVRLRSRNSTRPCNTSERASARVRMRPRADVSARLLMRALVRALQFHPWVNADFMLEKCLVGALAEGDLPEPESDDEEMLAADGGTDDTGDGSGDSGGGGGSAGGDEGARGRGVSSGGAQRPGSPIMGVVTP